MIRYDFITEVKKYNPNHDALGRFSTGSATGGMSRRTMPSRGGGISIHVKSGREPKDGYMVAMYGERSVKLSKTASRSPKRREAAIKEFMEKNKDVLADKNNFLGTWYNTETREIYLDISRNFKDKNKAVKYASDHNEISIWDVKNMEAIPTGGTGEHN